MSTEVKRAMQGLLMAGEDLRDITLDGSKQLTMRKGHIGYTSGPVLIGFPELDWCTIKTITSVRHTTLGETTIDECNADGCADHEELLALLRRFYPELELSDPVTVIRFK